MDYATGTQLFSGMWCDVMQDNRRRKSGDPASPAQEETLEAVPGRQYMLNDPAKCFVGCKSIDLAWTCAYVLHFFTGSEQAASLRCYNKQADRFLTGDRWVGAYGAIAMPQLGRCVELLQQSPQSRRAVISMGELGDQDLNRPACPSMLHLLATNGKLDLLVYQRSLYLTGLAPYDMALYCNILNYASACTDIPMGKVRWTVGSLHVKVGDNIDWKEREPCPMLLPPAVLHSPIACAAALEDPSSLLEPFAGWMIRKERT